MFPTKYLAQKKPENGEPDSSKNTNTKKTFTDRIKTALDGENKGLPAKETTTTASKDGGPPKIDTKITAKEALKDYQPGQGIASKAKDTSSVFRVLNAEMFAKPNLKVAVPGTIIFGGCVLYLAYMKLRADEAVRQGTHFKQAQPDGKYKMAYNDKGSKWD